MALNEVKDSVLVTVCPTARCINANRAAAMLIKRFILSNVLMLFYCSLSYGLESKEGTCHRHVKGAYFTLLRNLGRFVSQLQQAF